MTMLRRRSWLLALAGMALLPAARAQAFDHGQCRLDGAAAPARAPAARWPGRAAALGPQLRQHRLPGAAAARERIRSGAFEIAYLDCGWHLNDAR